MNYLLNKILEKYVMFKHFPYDKYNWLFIYFIELFIKDEFI